MPTVPLFRNRYREYSRANYNRAGANNIGTDGNLTRPNHDHCVFFEPIKAGEMLQSIRIRMAVASSEEMELYQTHTFQMALIYYETSLADGQNIEITSYDDAETLLDKIVPKYDDAKLVGATFTPTESDYEVGDVDDDTMYQLDKLPLSILTNPTGPAIIKRMRPWLGWYEGSAYRTGNGDNVRTLWMWDELIRIGIRSNRHGYLFGVLSNPGQPMDYTVMQTLPRQTDWENLNFLTPHMDLVTGNTIISPSTNDDWRR